MSSLLERHSDKWTPEPNTGCYLWIACLSTSGRPNVYAKGRTRIVARLVCEEVNGPPPTLKHDAAHNTPNGCVGGLCVNSDHLRWASRRENALDTPEEIRRKPRNRGLRHATLAANQKTYFTGKPCANGHVDLRYASGGCLTCLKERKQRYRRQGITRVFRVSALDSPRSTKT
jgi:hypothetical protein